MTIRELVTLVMGFECTWCSCHSPGTVSGNFIARRVPVLVPAKSIRPDRDITHCVNTMSLAGTSRRICWKQTRFTLNTVATRIALQNYLTFFLIFNKISLTKKRKMSDLVEASSILVHWELHCSTNLSSSLRKNIVEIIVTLIISSGLQLY